MIDITKLLGPLKEAEEKLKVLEEQTSQLQATGESGGGCVKATVDGRKQILKIEIDKEVIDPREKEILQDLIVAAVNIAVTKVDEKVKEEVRKNSNKFLSTMPLDMKS